jgi:hypothetical protein
MLLRRLYSSAPPTRPGAGPCLSGPSTSRPPTRGRSKPQPARSPKPLRTSGSPSSLANQPIVGKGRRRRSISLSLARKTEGGKQSTFSHPTAADYAFRPAQIYPAQMTLHKAFLPRHMPIPVHLGSSIYLSPKKIELSEHESLGPFARPTAPSPGSLLNARSEPSDSALADHLHVTSSLSHPSLEHHLGSLSPFRSSSTGSLSQTVLDDEAFLPRTLSDAGVRSRLAGEWAWQQTLARLSGSTSAAKAKTSSAGPNAVADVDMSGAVKEDVDAAVADLAGLLERLDAPARGRRKGRSVALETVVDEDVVELDSVKRKRKKKVS